MNYADIYNNLINSRREINRNKVIGDGLEYHHIIPRSLGGDNSADNIVLLTPREHFIAHRLLVKFHTGKRKAKMVYALKMMSNTNSNQKRTYITSRHYMTIKNYINSHCVKENHPNYGKTIHSDHTRKQISNRMKGDNNPSRKNGPWNKGITGYKSTMSDEYRESRRVSLSNRVWTDEMRESVGKAHRGKPKTEEHRKKLSQANKGRKRSAESIEKSAQSKRGQTQILIKCPHCDKQGGVSAMHRWHMDKCNMAQ